ncbi:MAG: peptidase domain-containing ABC transporter [Sediminibacterium sp.]|nr:peptidase domain-containing ABC transporter [Sediminibacterium sp.]
MKTPKIIQQLDFADCGPVCLLTIIEYYGGTHSLENLRKLSGTNITGTTLLGLYQAAKAIGFDAEGCEGDIEVLDKLESPCILHVMIDNKLQHYVVYYGVIQKNGEINFIIGDPAKGIVYLRRNDLDTIWQSKTCLTLTPNESFKKATDIGKSKRYWIFELVKSDTPLLLFAAGLGIVIAALGLVMAIFSQRLIDDILPKQNFTKLNIGVALVFLLLLFKEAFSYLRQYFLIRQSKDFNIRIIDFFYSHLLKLPKPFFDTRKIGELTARLNDTSRIQRVISQLAGNVIIDVLIVIVSTIFIFAYSWQVGVSSIIFIPIFFYLIYRNVHKISNGQRSIMNSYAQTESNYISTLQGIEPIKNYNKEELFEHSNAHIYKKLQDNIFSLGKTQMRLSFTANIFATAFLTGLLLFASYQVLNNYLKLGELIALLGMAGSLLPSVSNLALVIIPINEAKVAFERMFEFTGIPPEQLNDSNLFDSFESLQVQKLAFRFPGRKRLLQNIFFEVNKGEIIALMGENGSGKSTLTQIIQQNYNAESGSICINTQHELKDISITKWRKCISVVPQQIHIFNGTVIENIAFDDAAKDLQKVVDFLIEYGFNEFIESLPQSLMTIVGEEGINLSGGQKQMIALARALYHKPQLLILDEATASMDRESEQFVLNLLTELKKSMGIIFITHRLHVLKSFCDRIYILENGETVVSGNHDALLLSNNLYSQYWNDLIIQ